MAPESNFPLLDYVIQRPLAARAAVRAYEVSDRASGRLHHARIDTFESSHALAWAEHELGRLREHAIDRVGAIEQIVARGDTLIVVSERVPGLSLHEYAGGHPMAVTEFVEIAVQIAELVGRVHERVAVHGDLRLGSIVFEPEARRLGVLDLGIARVLDAGRVAPRDPHFTRSLLPYYAPERVRGGVIDSRSDLHALGVVFYELLTGRRPFLGGSVAELHHALLARRPRPPRELRDNIPPVLDAIVMRLLEKLPEQRYRSARGLAHDLAQVAAALAEGLTDPELALGRHDHPMRLEYPQRLFGRADAGAKLQRSFAELRERGEPRSVLVRGDPGSGKTSLMRMLEGVSGTWLAHGTFVEPESDRPFRGLAEAIAALFAELEHESEARRHEWREHLRERLGTRLELFAELVPSLDEQLGPRLAPSLLGAGSSEAESRLQVALARLLSSLAERGPVVLVLDDVDRADASSLALVRMLLGGVAGPVMLVLSATRGQSVSKGFAALERELLERGHGQVIELEPLAQADVEALLGDMLGRSRDDLRELAATLHERSGGNPLELRGLIEQLGTRGILRVGATGWQWDLAAIDEVAPAETSTIGRLQRVVAQLDADARALLDTLACFGRRLDHARLGLLAPADHAGELELVARVHRLEREGLLVRMADEHRFVHERIRQWLCESLALERRAAIHWRLALALGDGVGDEARPRRLAHAGLFELAEHVARGLAVAGELAPALRSKLFALELAATERALRAGAWASAERYARAALELHPGGESSAFAVRFAHAQALALSGRSQEADEAFARLLEGEPSFPEFGRAVARRIQILLLEGRVRLALEFGSKALARCIELPRGGRLRLPWMLRRATRRARACDLRAFVRSAGAVADARIDAALWIMDSLETPAFMLDRALWAALCIRHFELVLDHGLHDTAAVGFVQFAIVLTGAAEFDLAVVLADHALALAERAPEQLRPRVEMRARLFVWPYTRPFAEVVTGLEELFQQALEVGDRETAGYSCVLGLRAMLEAGLPLRELISLGHRALAELGPAAPPDQRLAIEASVRSAELLAARRRADVERRTWPDAGEVSEITRVGIALTRALTELLFGDAECAYVQLRAVAGSVERAGYGTWMMARYAPLDAIARVDAWREAGQPKSQRRALLGQLQRHLARLRRLAARAPANFSVLVEIVRAELEWVRGHGDAAMQTYELARASAEARGQLHIAILAAQRLATLAAACGAATSSKGALRFARLTQLRWGALGLAEQLVSAHPELVGESGVWEGSEAHGEFELDVDAGAMLATLQAISEELHLDQVIVRVVRAAIEHSGAGRGLLVLEREGVLGIVAEGGPANVHEFLDSPTPLDRAAERLPRTVVRAVMRTGKAVMIDEFDARPEFTDDPYFGNADPAALLCLPVVKHSRPVGALLLEQEAGGPEFDFDRLEILRSFANQAAAALDNARLYDALQRGEAQWRSVVGGVPDIIALLDQQGRVEFVNHLDPFPVSTEMVRGNSAEATMSESTRPAWRAALDAVLAGEGARELELEIAPVTHPPRWYAVRLSPIEVEGRIEKVIAIATDIDERRRGEARQAILEAQLRQQQRLESLGTLASGVAHEINNPIQGIMNYAELMRGQPDDREMIEEFATEIQHESQRVAAIVRNLLAFSRQERDQQDSETLGVEVLVERALALIRAVLRKDRIELVVDVPADLPRLQCRPAQIQQILMNLVTNARDALNERQASGANRWIRISASTFVRENAGWMRLSVEDRGGGIDEGVLARIFDPFFTTKGRDKGTGLGLAVSHGIATEHGGRLWVDNHPKVGATFHLDLPLSNP